MALVIKIAWRNLWRHKGKSLVIGAILFLGALFMSVGNGVVSGMDKGLRKSVVDGFLGDVVIIPDSQETDDVLLSMMGKAIEPINNYPAIRSALDTVSYIDKTLPVGKNMAMVINEDGGTPGFAFLFGVDFKKYREMFPDNFKVIEGRPVRDEEKGMMVPTGARLQFYDFTNIWFMPDSVPLDTAHLEGDAKLHPKAMSIKHNAVFMGFNDNNSANDIRLPILGVMKFSSLNKIWGHFVLVDIESYRQCLGYVTAADKADTTALVKARELESEMGNLDALFGEGDLMVENTGGPVKSEKLKVTEQFDAAPVDMETGTYNLVLVRLKKGADRDAAIKEINRVLKAGNLAAHAVTWEKAAGIIGSMTTLIKTALFVFVFFLFFVAIIVIINTLSMAALERVTEIGMMRAVGARKSFISRMFLAETGVLAFFFGGLGVVAGAITVRILSAVHFTSENDMVQLVYGGDTFQPLLTGADIGLCALQLILVTVLAVVYPLKLARAITPLDAITRD